MGGKKLSILFIASWYPRNNQPFLGTFVQKQAQAIAQFADVFVWSIFPVANQHEPYKTHVNENGKLTEINVSYQKTTNPVVKLMRVYNAYKLCRQELSERNKKPDLIHLHVIFPAFLYALLAKWHYSKPLIITEHSTGYLPADGHYKGTLKKLFTRYTVSQADMVITVSEDLKQRMLSHGLDNSYKVISNIIDTSLFFPQEKVKTPIFKLLHISSLDNRQKNVSGIIDAIDLLIKKGANVQLNIIGSGGDELELKNLAAGYKLLDTSIFFSGNKWGPDLAGAINDSDTIVLNSNYENQPVVLLEALACGKPVIAPKVGGIPEFINEKNGVLFQPGNTNELVSAIQHMMNNFSLYNPKVIAEFINQTASNNVVATQHIELYRTLLKIA